MASRQATHNKRARTERRIFGECGRCGRKHGPDAYCGRDPDRRREQQAALMRARRAKGLA